MDFGYTMKALRSKKKVDSYGLWLHHESFEKQEEELKPQPDLKGVRSVSLLKDTKPKTHMDFGYTMKALRSKKKVGVSSVSLLEDTKPKTHMDFGYTMKALRSKKKVDSYGLWLHHESFEKQEEDTKPKTHMDFGYTMKALRSKKKVAKDSYGLWLHHESFEKQEEGWRKIVSLLEDTKPKTHMDFGYTMKALRSKKKVELKPQPDLKSLSSVSLLEDTKPKTHMDFGYTMKALRSKKKVG
ncbi:hypothetical protein AtEden1_Chr00c004g0324541 [Arabidopsis thaliana]